MAPVAVAVAVATLASVEPASAVLVEIADETTAADDEALEAAVVEAVELLEPPVPELVPIEAMLLGKKLSIQL